MIGVAGENERVSDAAEERRADKQQMPRRQRDGVRHAAAVHRRENAVVLAAARHNAGLGTRRLAGMAGRRAFWPQDLKKDLLEDLDKICPAHTIFASNTSGLSITEMAACIPQRSDKFIGCHFFNPAQIMKLVEVIRALQTSDETFQKAFDLMTSLGKTPVAVHEGPGFVVNRILIPMMNEAMGIVADGIASPADIDVAMQLGAGMKSGPLHTADLVGHDVNLAIMETLYHETGDPKYRPHPLMRKMVRAGWLGVKTGKGFFEYDGPFGKEIVK